MENAFAAGEQRTFRPHGEHSAGDSSLVQLHQRAGSFLRAADRAAEQLDDFVFIGLDEGRLFLHGGYQAAAAGVDENRDAGLPAAADQAAVYILRNAFRNASADGNHIHPRKFPVKIGQKTGGILRGHRSAGLQVFGGPAVRQIPAVDAGTGFRIHMCEGAADQGTFHQGFQVFSVEAAGEAHGNDLFPELRRRAADVQPLAAGGVVDFLYPHDGFGPDLLHQVQFVNGRIERDSQNHPDMPPEIR